MSLSRILLASFLIKLMLVALLFNGFITNFLSFSSLNLGTVLVDLLIFTIILHLTIRLIAGYFRGLQLSIIYFNTFVFWAILLALTILKLTFIDTNPWSERLLGMRNNIVYMIPLIYIPVFFKKESDIDKVISFFLKISLVLVFFSLIQYAFSSKLPESLLVLRGESIFSFYGTTIVRPTALLGNTIIFASFTLVIFAFYLSKYLYHRKRSYLILLIIISIANIVTFTRASIVGLVIVVLVSLFLRYGRLSLSFIIRITSTLFVIILIAASGLYFYQDSFIVKRITGREITTHGSTSEHIQQIEASVKYLKKHYVAGAGVGSQGASGDPSKKIITDGYWFQLMLEKGIVLGLFYFAFYASCALFALRTFYRTDNLLLKQLCMAFVAFSAYFYAASILNSGFAGRINFISYWIVFGLLVAQYLNIKYERHAHPSR
jgi:hypothetical protein